MVRCVVDPKRCLACQVFERRLRFRRNRRSTIPTFYSQSSIRRGQSFLSSRERERSAITVPPVWQAAQ